MDRLIFPSRNALCCCSVTQSCPISCKPVDCSTPGLPVPHHLLRVYQVHVRCIGDATRPSHPLALCSFCLSLPSIKDFDSESVVHIRWRKCWSLRRGISPSSEYSGLISLKIDSFDLPAVQGTLRSLLQHHSSKASNIWCSAFSKVQFLQPSVTTGNTITLTIQTFVSRVMSLPHRGKGVGITQWHWGSCRVRPPKTDRPQWRAPIKRDPPEEGMEDLPSTLAMRTSWTVYKEIPCVINLI